MAWSPEARRAAALARKRKAKGKKRSLGSQINRESARRQAGAKKYKGRGGYARAINDYTNSTGNFRNNPRGKRVSKVRRGYRKVSGTVSKASVAYQVSKRRGKKAATKKRK